MSNPPDDDTPEYSQIPSSDSLGGTQHIPPVPPPRDAQSVQAGSPATPAVDGANDEDRPSPTMRAGVGAGCGVYFLLFVVVMVSLVSGAFAAWAGIWAFVPAMLVFAASVALMFTKRWRRFATGLLIVGASSWIVVLGPCMALTRM